MYIVSDSARHFSVSCAHDTRNIPFASSAGDVIGVQAKALRAVRMTEEPCPRSQKHVHVGYIVTRKVSLYFESSLMTFRNEFQLLTQLGQLAFDIDPSVVERRS